MFVFGHCLWELGFDDCGWVLRDASSAPRVGLVTGRRGGRLPILGGYRGIQGPGFLLIFSIRYGKLLYMSSCVKIPPLGEIWDGMYSESGLGKQLSMRAHWEA